MAIGIDTCWGRVGESLLFEGVGCGVDREYNQRKWNEINIEPVGKVSSFPLVYLSRTVLFLIKLIGTDKGSRQEKQLNLAPQQSGEASSSSFVVAKINLIGI